MNAANCASLKKIPPGLSGVWYRAIQSHHLKKKALATSHTKTISSRFNAGSIVAPHRQFEILYLAENHNVALYEVQALLGTPTVAGSPFPHPLFTWTVLNVHVALTDVVDMTKVSEQAVVETTAQELTGDWRGYELRDFSTSVKEPTAHGVPPVTAPTQEFGEELYNSTLMEGFISISAKVPDQKVLIIFPERVRKNQPHSFVKFFNPITGQTESVI
jgi:hypothetical protein